MKKNYNEKVRYAVVGAGWIAQAAFMPGVHHTGNSEMVAIVTGDEKKAKELAKKYGIKKTYNYSQYDELLESSDVDAVYLALPNDMHLEYALRTLHAGKHLLLEKPMAENEEDCRAIVQAAMKHDCKLMVAYRLHFEPTTLKVIDLVSSGKIGEPRVFSSVFCQKVSEKNHRCGAGHWAGPLQDMGPYPINGARNLFGAEPIEVQATLLKISPTDELVSAILKFSENRVAQFTVGYGPNGVDEYRVVGTKGDIHVSPGFGFGEKLQAKITLGDEKPQNIEGHETDQFGAETKYFSDCIREEKEPEPDGAEGFADVRVINAIEQAIETGEAQRLDELQRHQRPGLKQQIDLPPVHAPKLIHASEPQRR